MKPFALRPRVDGKLRHQARGRKREQAGEHEEHVAPAEKVTQDTAGGLAKQLPKNLAGDEPPQDLLQAVMRDDIADIAIEIGMTHPAAAPVASRANASCGRGRHGPADGDQHRADGAGQRHGSRNPGEREAVKGIRRLHAQGNSPRPRSAPHGPSCD
jgi:hypothetical protein